MRNSAWLATYVPDVARPDVVHVVGVLVEHSDGVVCRFLGERDDKSFDEAQLVRFNNAKVYMRWVRFWRETLADGASPEALQTFNTGALRIARHTIPDIDASSSSRALLERLYQTHVAPETEVTTPFVRTARYWLVQDIPDMRRCETQNIGVIVELDAKYAGAFVGEDAEGNIRRRKLKRFKQSADTYARWVMYWQEQLSQNTPPQHILSKPNSRFRLSSTGTMRHVGPETHDRLAKRLFAKLVSTPGSQHTPTLTQRVKRAFKALIAEEPTSTLHHPMRPNAALQGKKGSQHTFDYIQSNGVDVLIEEVDLSGSRLKFMHNRASATAYKFRDVGDMKRKTERFSIYQLQPNPRDPDAINNILEMLRNESTIVDWSEPTQREPFVAARERIAFEPPH